MARSERFGRSKGKAATAPIIRSFLVGLALTLLAVIGDFGAAVFSARAQAVDGFNGPPPAMKFLSSDPVPLSALSSLIAGASTVTDSIPNCAAGQVSNCQAIIAPEIRELARGLRYDPALIFSYVHDRVGMHPVFGASKGALGALIDQNGSAFDQVMLASDLLRASNGQSGRTIATQMRIGSVRLTAAQFSDWFGISDAKAACQFLGAGGFPAIVNGASSCASLTGSVTSVEMAHAWLSVTINGIESQWDVAFKGHAWNAGLDIGTLSGMAALDPVSTASTGVTTGLANGNTPWAKGFSFSALDTNLKARAAQLHTALSANTDSSYRDSSGRAIKTYALTLEQVVGLPTVRPLSEGESYFPLAVGIVAPKSYASLPDQYRTKLLLVVGNNLLGSATQPLFADEIAGRQFYISTGDFGSLNNYRFDLQLIVEGQVVRQYAGNEGVPGRVVGVTWSVDHPYPASGGQFADETVTRPLELISDAVIVAGFGSTSPALGGKLSSMLGHEKAVPWFIGLGDTGEEAPVDAPRGDNQRFGLAASWLAQFSRMVDLQSGLARARPQHHHSFGFVSSHTTLAGGAVVTPGDESLHIDVSTSFGLTGVSSATPAGVALRKAISTGAATLESSIFQQQNDAPDVASTVERFAWATATSTDPSNLQTDPSGRYAGPYQFYVIDSTNVSSLSEALFTYSGRTTCYPEQTIHPDPDNPYACTLKSVVRYVNWLVGAGYRVVLAKDTYLGPGMRCGRKSSIIKFLTIAQPPNFATTQCAQNHKRGFALIGFNDDGSKVVHLNVSATQGDGVTEAKGGGATAFQDILGGARAPTSADLIKFKNSLSSGAAISGASGETSVSTGPLVSAGQGDFPYSLSFERSYSSSSSYQPWRESAVWSHSYDVRATVSGSGLEGMGASRAINAAPSLVAFLALQKAYAVAGSGADIVKREVSGALVGKWWADQIKSNVVSIQRGASAQQFVRRPDGGFNAPAGSIASLQQAGERTLEIVPVRMKAYSTERRWRYPNVSFKLISADKDELELGFQPQDPLTDPDFEAPSDVTRFGASWVPTTWQFPTGVKLTFTYSTVSVGGYTISQPYLSSVSNNLGASLSFTYAAQGLANGAADISLASVTATGGAVAQFSRNADGSVHTVTRPDGTVLKYTFLVGEQPLVSSPTNAAAPQNAEFYAANGGSGRPGFRKLLSSITTARDTQLNQTSPTYKIMYDHMGRGKWIDVAKQDGANRAYRRSQTYIADGWRSEQVSPLGASVVDLYDYRGERVAAIDPIGRTGRAEYDGLGRIVKAVSPYGDFTEYTYDLNNNVTKIMRRPRANEGDPTFGQTPTTLAEYGNSQYPTKPTRIRQPATVADPNPEWYEFTYDAKGLLTQMTLPTTYDSATGTNKRGAWTFAYADAFGRPTRETDPTGRATAVAYGEVVNGVQQPAFCATSAITDPGGLNLTTRSQCNAAGDVTAVIDPRGAISTTSYDAMRRKTRSDGPTGTLISTRWIYDADGSLLQELRQKAANVWLTTSTSYSPTGKPLVVTDPSGDRTRTCYDTDDRPTIVVDPDGRAARTSYNAAGDPRLLEKWLTADLNDAACAVTVQTAPTAPPANIAAKIIDGTARPNLYRAWAYTSGAAGGMLEKEIDANGNATSFAYEGLGRLIQTTYQDPDGAGAQTAPFEVFQNNERGQVINKRQRSGLWVQYAFDAMGRPSTVYQQSAAGTFVLGRQWAFDLAGRRLAGGVFSCSGVNCATFGAYQSRMAAGYDGAGRMTLESTFPAGGASPVWTVSHQFDAASNRTALIWPDGYQARYTYDAANRMSEARAGPAATVASAPQVRASFTLDPLSRRTGVTRANGANTTLAFEDDGDLAQISHAFPSGALPNAPYSYTSLPSGRVQSVTIGASALQWLPPATYGRSYGVANGLNQLPSEAANAIAWEALNGQNTGNMASASLDGSATITSFAHDGMNRMVTASRAGMAAAYSYDIDDRRIGKTVTQTSTISTRTLWSGADELAEYDGAGALLRRVIPGPAIDDKVAVVEASGAVSYFHTDRLGSVVAVSNGAGAASETYAYSPYGESANPVTGNPWRFTGRYLDAETGLYYYRARYYSPRLGQFLQTDPIGSKDDPNLTMYVGLDPGNKTDPSGRELIWQFQNGAGREQADETLGYLSGSSTAQNELKTIIESNETYVIVVDPTAESNEYQFRTRVVTWNPLLGSLRTDGQIESPASILGHEVSHAAQHERVGVDEFRESLESETLWTVDGGDVVVTMLPSTEEQRATRVQGQIQRELGEPVRSRYNDGSRSIRTAGPASRVPAPSGWRMPRPPQKKGERNQPKKK